MTNMKNTKRALASSILALFLCFAMLIGTTYAWFTDSVTSNGNIIKSGTLEVEMYYADGKLAVPANDSSDWKNADGVAIYTANQLWEPGYTDAKHIKISNVGNLALKYQLAIVPNGEVSELANVIDVYYVENATQIASRKDLANYTPIGTLAELINNGITQGFLSAYTDYTATLVLAMRGEEVGNEYQNLSIGDDFSIRLLATQYNEENDTYNPDYDKEAWINGMKVYNASDLQAAISAGEDVVLMNDIVLDEQIVIPASSNARAINSTIINLNGKKLSNANGTVIRSEGNLVLTGKGVIECIANAYAIRAQQGSLLINSNDITVNAVFGAVSMFNDAQVTINGGTYTVSGAAGKTHHCVYIYSGADLTINGGTFAHNGAGISDSGATLTVYAGANGGVTINGGTFIGSGTYIAPFDKYDSSCYLTINGGTFSKDASKYVSEGFKSVKNGNLYYVVPDGIDNVIVTPQDLASFGGTKVNGTYMLMADINMAGVEMKSMELTPHANVTFIGNGHTISNLTLTAANCNGMEGTGNEVAGLFDMTENSGCTLTVKDLVFENANISCSGYAAVIVGYAQSSTDIITLDNVDIKGATVISDSVAALIGYTVAPATLTNCDVSDLTLTGEAGRPDKVGAFIGTANTASCTVNVSNCTNATTYSDAGRVINGAVWNGILGVNSLEKLQTAINELAAGSEIVLRDDITGNATIDTGKQITIDGADNDYYGSILIGVNENVAIKNVNFRGTVSGTDAFIRNEGSPTGKNYNSILLVENCTFIGDGSASGIKTIHPTLITVNDCEADTLYGFIHNTGGQKFDIDGITVKNVKNGVSFGSVKSASIKNADIEASNNGYGVRIDANNENASYTVEDCDITAFIPVVVRKAAANNVTVTVDGNNTMTETNDEGIWCAVANNEYGDFDNGVFGKAELTAITKDIAITVNDAELAKDTDGLYVKK